MNKNKGFTLIEVLVVTGMMGLLMTGVVGVLLNSVKISNKSSVFSRVDSEGEWILSSMRRQIIHADPTDNSTDGIKNCTSTCKNKLEIISRLDGGKTIYDCRMRTGGTYYIASVSAVTGNAYNLSSAAVTVDCSSFCITCTGVTSQSPNVSIGFTLNSGSGFADNTGSKSFTDSFSVRY